jgi:hypothetical protein
MKLLVLVIITVVAGIISAEHLYSYLYGLFLALIAVGSCYWFAFRSFKFPSLALFLLVCGMLSKLLITVTGVVLGMNAEMISSPIIFSLAYLFFAVVTNFVLFFRQDKNVKTEVLHSTIKSSSLCAI